MHKISKTLLNIIVLIVVSTAIYLFMLIGLSGYMKSDPAMYLASGKTLSGVVLDKQRDLDGFALVIDTNEYDELSIGCSAEDFSRFDVGDTVSIGFKFEISEV